jgi:hypothetical protein
MGEVGADRLIGGLSAHLTPTKRKPKKTKQGKCFPTHCSVTAASARGKNGDILVLFSAITSGSCADCSSATARRVAPASKSMFSILIWIHLNSSHCAVSIESNILQTLACFRLEKLLERFKLVHPFVWEMPPTIVGKSRRRRH